jgi:hypothetical protein
MGKKDSSHARYVANRFIPNSKLIFSVESMSSTDYHMEMNSETFNELFLSKFLLYLRSELTLLHCQRHCCSIQTSATKT